MPVSSQKERFTPTNTATILEHSTPLLPSQMASESESQVKTKETVLVVFQRRSVPFSHLTTSCPSPLPYLLLSSS